MAPNLVCTVFFSAVRFTLNAKPFGHAPRAHAQPPYQLHQVVHTFQQQKACLTEGVVEFS
jgi:hypothetical protein